MIRTIITIVLLCLIHDIASTQTNITIINQSTIGGNLADQLSEIVRSHNNGYYIGGSSHSNISGEKDEDSYGWSDYWIIKTNSDLNLTWQKTIGGEGVDFLYDFDIKNDGNIICFGSSGSSISGLKTVPNYGSLDMWIFEIDTLGSFEWQNSSGGTEFDWVGKFLYLDNGNTIMGCTSDSDSSGTKTEDSRGMSDYWITCIDSGGNYLWDKTYGGTSVEMLFDMQQIDDSLLLISGISSSPISGEKTEACYGMYDIWLLAINVDNGDIYWDKTLGGSGDEYNADLLLYNDDIYILSQSSSGISGTKTEASFGESDFWLIKMTKNGDILWDKTIGGSNREFAQQIITLNNNSFILAGTSTSGISGHKTEANIGGYDYWIVNIDTSGNVLWDKTIGGTDDDMLKSIIETDDNHLLLGGNSKSGISGNKTDFCRGEEDFWLVELAIELDIPELTGDSNVTIYPNPSTGTITIENNENSQISVYDNLGNLILTTQQSDSQISLDLSEYANGIYFVKVVTEDQIITLPVSLNR